MLKHLVPIAAILGLFSTNAHGQERREIDFPDTRDGLSVAAIDTHVHTVFSDGLVWPSVRVTEAVRDGLDAFALTDHIDTQAHHADIPNPDRNRSFEIARKTAQQNQASTLVIRGVEIADPTRLCIECAHFNAIFIQDANALRHRGWNGRLKFSTNSNLKDAFASVDVARKQGAFIIWNHPTENGALKMIEPVRQMLQSGVIGGIEVVNGKRYFEGAFQFALDHDLAIIGASDVHDAVENMFDVAHGEGRTATLVLAEDKSEAALKRAMEARRTVALSNDTLMGRERDVRPIVEASLAFFIGDAAKPDAIVVRNGASSPFSLRRVNADKLMTANPVITVPAHGEVTLRFFLMAGETTPSLEFDVLNALVGPRHPLRIAVGKDGYRKPLLAQTSGQAASGRSVP